MHRADQPSYLTSLYVFLITLNATLANHSSQIDTEKLALLAGFANGKSANNSWCIIKKKLMGGATLDGAIPAKKPKTKVATNGDAEDDDEPAPTKAAPKKRTKAIKAEPADAEGGDADEDEQATTVKAAPKKRGKAAIKAEPVDAEGGDADTEVTPSAESPKKATPKRKRGPNKPKDPNAPPAKRGKKGAANTNNNSAVENENGAASAQLHANQNGSIFGGDANVEMEVDDQEDGDDRPFDAEEQKLADDTLFGINTYEETAF